MLVVKASQNTTALFIISAIALLANVALIIYHVYKIVKNKRNPLKDEIYTDLQEYKSIVEANK